MCLTHTATWALGVHNSTCVTYLVNDTLSIQAALVAGFTCMVFLHGDVNIKWPDAEQETTGAMHRRKSVLDFCPVGLLVAYGQWQIVLKLSLFADFPADHHIYNQSSR